MVVRSTKGGAQVTLNDGAVRTSPLCHKRTRAALMLAVAAALTACVGHPGPVVAGSAAQGQPVAELMEQALVPGLQMAVVDNGKIEVLPFGVADVQTRAR